MPHPVPPSDSSAANSLVVTDPTGAMHRVELSGDSPIVIGRGAGCAILFDHEQVSRRHAEITRSGPGDWVIRDLGSRNGVLCGGRPLPRPTPMRPGVAFSLGPYTVALEGRPSAATPPPAAAEPEYHTIAAVDDRKTSTIQPITHAPRHFDPAILSKLHQLDQWLMDLPDADQRYRRLCEFVIHANPGAQYCAVILADAEGDSPGQVRVLQSIARDAMVSPYVSRTLLDQVLTSGEPTLLSNTPERDDGLMLSIAPEQVLLSAIACPLDETGGGPVFYATFHTREVDPSWLDLMVLIADQYRHAEAMLRVIENANERAALDRDLARAREIQNGLLPKPWESGALDIAFGFRPCLTVGGDYLDVVPMPDGRVLLAIADVTGKGLQAALIASSIHTMVHAVVQTGGGLPDILRQLNQYLIHYAPAGSFATMILVAVDPAEGKAEVLNAGHPPIVCIDPERQPSALEHATGFLPLGIDEQDYESSFAEVQPGHAWFFYTDGLSELPLPGGDGMLGIEGVTRVTGELAQGDAQGTIDQWMAHLATENAGQGQADDQTLICLRRPG